MLEASSVEHPLSEVEKSSPGQHLDFLLSGRYFCRAATLCISSPSCLVAAGCVPP